MDSLKNEWWILHINGASRVSRARISLLLQSPTREQLEQAIKLGFPVPNNEVEYEAILVELNLALTLSATELKICSDFQLIIGQILGE